MVYNSQEGLDFNYYALVLCLLYPLTPEQAFYILTVDHKPSQPLTYEDYKVTAEMHKSMTLKQVGKLLGVSESGISRRMKAYKQMQI